jgi:nanoRNase/pAp phosphatase (c-di-AMP/oligoRNAs hydrolase)
MLAAEGFTTPKQFHFLPGAADIKNELGHLQKFIIKVDVSKVKLETISYDIKDSWLSIYLTPEQGLITKNELRTAQSSFKFDLIITLNTPDLESLGGIFLNNTDLFYRTPVINIDYHGNNERYGQINAVDLTATSTSEIVYQLLRQIDEAAISKEIATALLTGMIATTKSFKTANVTPQALNVASSLIKLGGERETIIQNLYRTRSLATLKLWGQALTHLKSDPALGVVSTMITREEFIHSGAEAGDLKGVVDDLISNSPEAKIVVLLYQLPGEAESDKVFGLISSERHHDALMLGRELHASGDKKQATFTLENKTLKEAEEHVLATLKNTLLK